MFYSIIYYLYIIYFSLLHYEHFLIAVIRIIIVFKMDNRMITQAAYSILI